MMPFPMKINRLLRKLPFDLYHFFLFYSILKNSESNSGILLYYYNFFDQLKKKKKKSLIVNFFALFRNTRILISNKFKAFNFQNKLI